MNGERGSILLWTLGLCIALFLLGGISLDLWRSFSERRALAAAADAAALSGASALDEAQYRSTGVVALDPAEAARRARASLGRQLDVHALRAVDVRVSDDTVTVVAHGHVGLTLLNLLHTADLDVDVTATATPRRSG